MKALLMVLPVSVALTLATTQSADARIVAQAEMTSRIERVLSGQGDPLSPIDDPSVRTREAVVHSNRDGRVLSMELPGSPASVRDHRGIALNTTTGRGFRTAVQETGRGSVRALIYIEAQEAQREYTFDLGPTGRAHLLPDGRVQVRDNSGNVLGSFARPWATDAAGAPVGTRYRVDGATLTQIIDVKPTTRFPVVADPFWIPFFILARVMLGIMTKHAARQAATRGVSQHLVRQVIKNGKATRGNNNSTVYSQGKGKNEIRIVVNNRTGDVVTVTKG